MQIPSRLRVLFIKAFGMDYRSLALLRAGTAVAILLNLSTRVPDLISMYSDEGCVPRSCITQLADSPFYFSIYQATGNWFLVGVLFILAAILALMLLSGYLTKFATIVSWIFLVSIQNRNPMVIDGQDMLLRMMLFWGIFLPWGDYLSIDSSTNKGATPLKKTICNAATFAYTLQILLIYLCTAVHKNGPEWTITGTAGLLSLNVDFITTQAGVYLTSFPELLKQLTFVTVALEFFCPLLIIMPYYNGLLRTLALAVLILFQLGLSLLFKLGFFPIFNVISLLALMPTSAWEKISAWFKNFPSERLHGLLYTARNNLPRITFTKPDQAFDPSKKSAIKAAYNCVIIFFLAYVCTWNLSTLPGSGIVMPTWTRPIADFFRLDQNWFMFAGFSPHLNGWYVMPGKLKNGQWVDIFRNGSMISWARPKLISNDYPNYQWRIYLVALFNHAYLNWRPYYASYLIRHWNKTHSQDKQLEDLQIYYMYEGLLPETNAQDRKNPVKLFVWEQQADRP